MKARANNKETEIKKLYSLINELEAENELLKKKLTACISSDNSLLKLSRAVEQSSASIVITDLSGTIEYVNPKFSEITGYTREEAIGINPRIFKTGHTTDREYSILWNTIRSGKSWNGEFCNKKKNGELYWEKASIAPVIDNSGKIINYVAVKEDITLQKQLEGELHKWAQFFEKSELSLCIGSADGTRIEQPNPAFATSHGYHFQELKDKPLNILFAPESLEEINWHMTIALANGHHTYETRHIRKDGSVFPVVVNITSIKNKQNEKLFLAISVQDTSLLKRAEQIVVESESRYRELFNGSRSGICVYEAINQGTEFIIKNINPAVEKIDKLDKYKVIGKSITEVFPGAGELGLLDAFKKVWATGEPVNFPVVLYKDDRIAGWRDNYIYKLPSGEIIAIYDDITKQKTAEIDLSNSEEKYKIAFKTSPDAVNITRLSDGLFMEINQGFTEITGYTEEDVKGKTSREINVWASLDDREKLLNEIKSKGYCRDLESQFRKKNGTLIYGKMSANLVQINNVMCILSVTHDITKEKIAEKISQEHELNLKKSNHEYALVIKELKKSYRKIREINVELVRSKEKAEESDRLKSAFLANMSHEIRTPMNGIIGFSQILSKPSLPDDKRKQYAQIIIQSSNQLLSIINDILDISRIETGQIEFNFENVSLTRIFDETYTFFSQKILGKKLNFHISKVPEDTDVIFKTDESKFKQIIHNLIGNAIKFTSQGFIKIGYTVKDTEVEFFVEDTGIGISSENHDKIFERFRQVELTSARYYGGAGLGLSITKNLVELLNGRIWVESALNKGSVFYFTLPYEKIIKHAPEDEENQNPEQLEIPGSTILIAEDEDVNYFYLYELLSAQAKKIIHAADGIEAVEACHKYPDIDLVLMDIKMPGMNGYDATIKIKEFRKDLPIIALTAFALPEDRQSALDAGCSDYLAKPVKSGDLFRIISRYLNKKTS